MRDVFCKIEAKGADARLKDPLLVSKANVDSNCDNLTDNESAHSKKIPCLLEPNERLNIYLWLARSLDQDSLFPSRSLAAPSAYWNAAPEHAK
ncbi:hypothetical protein Rt10032_c07g3098 [Rhodotorula toruloides]|uniref:Uncharacterized protein n=1 Tax=Rhodotorula toruloides TaxID=5286 RepID=A0A511KFD3_RHOTO|nr:hypothetical protein Rt10032_c07g3098 [Rhodotorula toruloides]